MKNIPLLLLFCILLASCQNNKTVEGDLYFKLVTFQNPFDAPDSILTKIETDLKSVNADTLNGQNKKNHYFLQFIIAKKLLRKPQIMLRKDDGEIITLFLDTVDYKKLKIYEHNELISENKKIRIKAEVAKLKYNSEVFYETLKPISMEKVDGKTYWGK